MTMISPAPMCARMVAMSLAIVRKKSLVIVPRVATASGKENWAVTDVLVEKVEQSRNLKFRPSSFVSFFLFFFFFFFFQLFVFAFVDC
jgi:hypothetical protein